MYLDKSNKINVYGNPNDFPWCPKFYTVPKIYKEGNSLKTIVSSIGSTTTGEIYDETN